MRYHPHTNTSYLLVKHSVKLGDMGVVEIIFPRYLTDNKRECMSGLDQPWLSTKPSKGKISFQSPTSAPFMQGGAYHWWVRNIDLHLVFLKFQKKKTAEKIH